jgi:preprotein translocase subunit SecF
MRLFDRTPDFDFMGRRNAAMTLSSVLMIASLVLLVFRGLNFGIDFTGGVNIEMRYEGAADLEQIRAALADEGFPDASVLTFGSPSEVLIRLPPIETLDEDSDEGAQDAPTEEDIGEAIERRLRQDSPTAERTRTEVVGRAVGEDLTEQGGQAVLFSLLLIFAYVMLRFRWKFAAGAIAALVHDVIITIGFFSAVNLTFDLPVLAAVLAVIGYSLNDTIVVYDRIRENFRFIRRGTPADIVNTSVNQTLARTLITGLTTLLVLLALYFLGGEALASFSLALITGVLVGTYSSIYVASAAALLLKVTPQDLMPVKVEEVDDLP